MEKTNMNKQKVLTSVAAASMVLTQAGQMSVFAEDTDKDLAKNDSVSSEKEEVKIEKTQKEVLEDTIAEAQKKTDTAKANYDVAEKTYNDYHNGTYADAEKAKNTAEVAYTDSQDATHSAIVAALENQISELEKIRMR